MFNTRGTKVENKLLQLGFLFLIFACEKTIEILHCLIRLTLLLCGFFCGFVYHYARVSQANWCNMTFTADNLFPSHTCIGVTLVRPPSGFEPRSRA